MRFCEMAAVTPQKRQCELGSYYPAGTLVKPPPRKAANTLGASGGQRNRKRLKANTSNRSERAEQEKYQSESCCKKSEIFT